MVDIDWFQFYQGSPASGVAPLSRVLQGKQRQSCEGMQDTERTGDVYCPFSLLHILSL